MIAMATHGRSGLGRWLLGSVAEKVLQAVPRPLLLVRAREFIPAIPIDVSYRRILVPLDGSPFAEQALGQAQAIAAATGATLMLVTVVPMLDDAALAEVGVVPAWIEASARLRSSTSIATWLIWRRVWRPRASQHSRISSEER
jgi:nucleotide-binding universal stress UspA family protein